METDIAWKLETWNVEIGITRKVETWKRGNWSRQFLLVQFAYRIAERRKMPISQKLHESQAI